MMRSLCKLILIPFVWVTVTEAASAMEQQQQQKKMIQQQIQARGVKDPRVLKAFEEVARHRFVSPQYQDQAYEDMPLPIGQGQTISQPYIVAYMVEASEIKPTDRCLEIGTGCGYQAAILSQLCKEVYSIEILPALAKRSQEIIQSLGYQNIHLRLGDGYQGWPEKAPFDVIVLAAAPATLPQTLLDQLKPMGRLLAPLGLGEKQQLVRIRKNEEGAIAQETLLPVRFVPMVKGGSTTPLTP